MRLSCRFRLFPFHSLAKQSVCANRRAEQDARLTLMLDFFHRHRRTIKDDVLSGLTVALALVPEAVAFAFVAGVSPIIGLYSAIIICLITSVLGGRPGMISAATGAIAVVIVTLVSRHGLQYLFPAVVLCGLIQIAAGVARLGKFIRMVPHSVMLGFVNGLAIVIWHGAARQLQNHQRPTADSRCTSHGPALWIMLLAMVGLTMLGHLAVAEIHAGRAGVAGGDPDGDGHRSWPRAINVSRPGELARGKSAACGTDDRRRHAASPTPRPRPLPTTAEKNVTARQGAAAVAIEAPELRANAVPSRRSPPRRWRA